MDGCMDGWMDGRMDGWMIITYTHTHIYIYIYSKSKDQPGKVANPAPRAQLSWENEYFSVPVRA